MKTSLNLRRLKSFVFENYPRSSPLREVIATEADEVAPSSFLEKLDIWLKLAELERARR